MASIYGIEFLEYFAFAFGSEELVGADADLQTVLKQLDGSPFSKIHALKEFGNSLFQEHQFAFAGECYDQACRQLGVALRNNSDLDLNSNISLAVSLLSELSCLFIKIQAFDGALMFYSVVLTFFSKNAKALYRKAVALRHLSRLSEASVTLKEAQIVEPHNKEINRELEKVVQALEINQNGERVVVETLDDTEARRGKKCVSSLQNPEAGLPQETQLQNFDNLQAEIDVYPDLTTSNGYASAPSPIVPMVSTVSVSCCVPEKSLTGETDCLSSSSTNLKSFHFTFTDKKRPQNTLKLSSHDYEKLLHGKNLVFYHPRSMSFMRVRTLTSKTIQTGTPHEEISGTAEVPTSSPTPESFVQEEIKVVQEEIVFQVDKKTRLTSASFCVSMVSLVQFNFTAVREHSQSSKGGYRSHARMSRPTACSKKRSFFRSCSCFTFSLQVHLFYQYVYEDKEEGASVI